MKNAKLLLPIAIIAFVLSCHQRSTRNVIKLQNLEFDTEELFWAFAEKYPDSAMRLLQTDWQLNDSSEGKADIAYKKLLWTECSKNQFQVINDTAWLTEAVLLYDSLAAFVPKNHHDFFLIQARLHTAKADILQDNLAFTSAFRHYLNAISILDARNNTVAKIHSLRGKNFVQMGLIAEHIQLKESAKELFNQSFHEYKQAGDSTGIAFLCYVIGTNNSDSRIENYKDTMSYYLQQGLRYVQPSRDSLEYALLIGLKSDSLRLEKKRDAAISCIQEAIQMMPKNYSDFPFQYTRLGFIYFLKEDFDSALYYVSKGYQTDRLFRKHSAACGLSDIYKYLNDNEKSSQFGEEARKLQNTINQMIDKNSAIQVLYNQYKLDAASSHNSHRLSWIEWTLIGCSLAAIFFLILFFSRKKKSIELSDEFISDPEITQSFMKRREKWMQSSVCQNILQTLPNDDELTTSQAHKIGKMLTTKDYNLLKTTANSIFYNALQRLHNEYPTLTKTDLEYCYLSLLDITDKQQAALLCRSYHTIISRKHQVCQKLNIDSLPLFLEQWIKNCMALDKKQSTSL